MKLLIILICGIGGIIAKHLYTKHKSSQLLLQKEREYGEETNRALLFGEIMRIARDPVTGLSVIQVTDDMGLTQTGISRRPVYELKDDYACKGNVKVPVLASTDGYGSGRVIAILRRLEKTNWRDA